MAHKTNAETNLRPVRTKEEARKRGSNGGKASGRSRAALKTFKEVLMDGLTKEEQEVMMKALKRNAMRGNLPSMEFLLKMMGQHPDQTANDGKSPEDRTLIMKIDGAEDYAE